MISQPVISQPMISQPTLFQTGNSMSTKSRVARRARSRGAALVEAAVVLPVLCTFLGMMIWFHSIYLTKQTLVLSARTEALTNASHACNGMGAPAADGSADGSLVGKSKDAAANGGVKESMTTNFNTAHGKAVGTAHGRGGTTGSWKRDMTYEASVMCNERSSPAGLAGMVGFAMNVVRSGNPF